MGQGVGVGHSESSPVGGSQCSFKSRARQHRFVGESLRELQVEIYLKFYLKFLVEIRLILILPLSVPQLFLFLLPFP